MRRPNFLWICTDQQRADTLGCYRNPFVSTPNLDRLADEGIVFDRCYAQSPICSPSRSSFLTGRYPRTTRCRQNGQDIPPDEVLVTRLLADAGYTCGLAGKLHLANTTQTFRPTEPRINDGYAEFHWSHHPDPWWPTNEYVHWLRAQGIHYERKPYRDSRYVQVSMPTAYHQTTWCAQQAIQFIEANAGFEQPWLFSMNLFDPHPPFDPPLECLERYLDRLVNIPLPSYQPGELEAKPPFQQTDHHGAYNRPGYFAYPEMSDTDHQLIRAAYWAMVDLIDEQVGRVLEALEHTGQRDHTVVIFMSDHGEMLGDHGLYHKGPYFYEACVRVPLIIAWPERVAAGKRRAALVELVDLAPTLLEAANLEPHAGMQGRSLLRLLTDENAPDDHREDVYCEYYNANLPHNPPAYATMLRTGCYKLVVAHGHDTGELYDLESDAHETHNLWNDSRIASVQMVLLQQLCDRMAWTADPLPVRAAGWSAKKGVGTVLNKRHAFTN